MNNLRLLASDLTSGTMTGFSHGMQKTREWAGHVVYFMKQIGDRFAQLPRAAHIAFAIASFACLFFLVARRYRRQDSVTTQNPANSQLPTAAPSTPKLQENHANNTAPSTLSERVKTPQATHEQTTDTSSIPTESKKDEVKPQTPIQNEPLTEAESEDLTKKQEQLEELLHEQNQILDQTEAQLVAIRTKTETTLEQLRSPMPIIPIKPLTPMGETHTPVSQPSSFTTPHSIPGTPVSSPSPLANPTQSEDHNLEREQRLQHIIDITETEKAATLEELRHVQEELEAIKAANRLMEEKMQRLGTEKKRLKKAVVQAVSAKKQGIARVQLASARKLNQKFKAFNEEKGRLETRLNYAMKEAALAQITAEEVSAKTIELEQENENLLRFKAESLDDHSKERIFELEEHIKELAGLVNTQDRTLEIYRKVIESKRATAKRNHNSDQSVSSTPGSDASLSPGSSIGTSRQSSTVTSPAVLQTPKTEHRIAKDDSFSASPKRRSPLSLRAQRLPNDSGYKPSPLRITSSSKKPAGSPENENAGSPATGSPYQPPAGLKNVTTRDKVKRRIALSPLTNAIIALDANN